MKRLLAIGLVFGMVTSAIAECVLPMWHTVSKVFIWPMLPGVMAVFWIKGGGTVQAPSAPTLLANTVIYGLAATLIATIVTAIRRPRPYPIGCCQKCGYNLTGNLSGVCPECGTKIEKPWCARPSSWCLR